MSRLTITVSDEIHQALKETAARTGKTIGSLVEEGLRLRGIKPMTCAKGIVAKARKNALLSEDNATKIAMDEIKKIRKQ